MNMFKKILAFILIFILTFSLVGLAFATENENNVAQTFLLLDVSGSTHESEQTLKSLYRYLLAIFETSSFEMDLTVLLFDEKLIDENQNNIIKVTVGNNRGTEVSDSLDIILSDKFKNDTAVYDSLNSFDKKYISKLSDKQKEKCNIVVFSDMKSTIRKNENSDERINELYSKWIGNKIIVKNLVWGNSSFVMEKADDINKIYNMDLSNKVPAYECLFHIYFDIITGKQPENYDESMAEAGDEIIYVWPDTYKLFVITDNPEAELTRIGEDGKNHKIRFTEIFPAENFADKPPRIIMIEKNELDKIGNFFIANQIDDFQSYSILSPQIKRIKADQNGNEILSENTKTNFEIEIDPQIRLWENEANNISAKLFIQKINELEETDDKEELKGIALTRDFEKSDRIAFKRENIDGFKNGSGDYEVTVKLFDSKEEIIAEESYEFYVTKSKKQEDKPYNGFENKHIIICLVIVFIILIFAFVMVIIKRKKKKKWKV